MGAWGTALFSDDLAADLRGEFRDLIGDGCNATQAVEKLKAEYPESLDDPDESPVFWLAIAAVQWELGHIDPTTQRTAIEILERGDDLTRWDDPKDRKKREKVLFELREKLESPPPKPKRVPKNIKEANSWEIGEVVGFRLLSGKWTLFRTIGHHEDKGGKFAVCEILNWSGEQFPGKPEIDRFEMRPSTQSFQQPQFMLAQPKSKKDQERIVRLAIVSRPAQKCGGYAVWPWKYADQLLKSQFGLE